MASPLRPRLFTSLAISRFSTGRTSNPATSAPSCAKATAIPRPRPRAEPVTIATFPFRSDPNLPMRAHPTAAVARLPVTSSASDFSGWLGGSVNALTPYARRPVGVSPHKGGVARSLRIPSHCDTAACGGLCGDTRGARDHERRSCFACNLHWVSAVSGQEPSRCPVGPLLGTTSTTTKRNGLSQSSEVGYWVFKGGR